LPNLVLVILEPVSKIREQENGSNRNHGRGISSSFLVAGSDATELLQTIKITAQG
jgi:hypothetical protein